MNHRRIAAPLVLTLTLAACGAGQSTATDTGVDATVVDTTAPPVSGSQSDEAGTALSSSSQTTTGANASDVPAIDNRGGTRLKSSVLGAAVEQVMQTSARFEAAIEVVSENPEMPGSLSLSFSGGYDRPNQATTMEMDLSGLVDAMAAEAEASGENDFAEFAGIFAEPMRVITIGDESWVQGGFFSMFGIEPGMWLAMEAAESEGTIEDFTSMGAPLDPTDFLADFEDANVSISELGTETIRGVETTHHVAEIDIAGLEDLAGDLDAEERAELEESLSQFGELDTLALDFWIGDDGLLRRMEFTVDTSDLPDNDGIVAFTMTFELYDYGNDLGITAPDPSLVVDEANWLVSE